MGRMLSTTVAAAAAVVAAVAVVAAATDVNGGSAVDAGSSAQEDLVPCRAAGAVDALTTRCAAACGQHALCVYRASASAGTTTGRGAWRKGATCAYECLAPADEEDPGVWTIALVDGDDDNSIDATGAVADVRYIEELTPPFTVHTVVLTGNLSAWTALEDKSVHTLDWAAWSRVAATADGKLLRGLQNVTKLVIHDLTLQLGRSVAVPTFASLTQLTVHNADLVAPDHSSVLRSLVHNTTLPALETLELAHIGSVLNVDAVKWPPRLTNVTLRDLGLVDVPTSLGSLTNLSALDLAHNDAMQSVSLAALPAKLSSLSLANCSLVSLPPRFPAHLPTLRFLDLSWNPMPTKHVPTLLPSSLESLALEGLSLNAFPAALRTLKRLRTLSLASNALKDANKSVHLPPALVSLDLSNCSLSTLPSALQSLDRLQQLFLHENPLTTLDALPSNLQTLSLSRVQLKALPPGVLPSSLQTLSLDDSALDSLPPDLSACIALRRLSLARNRLAVVDASALSSWPAITSLDLSGNRLRNFSGVTLPPTLNTLGLAGNRLASFRVLNHSQLRVLHLEANSLTAFPRSVFGLSGLSSLFLDGNAIPTPQLSADEYETLLRLQHFSIDVSTRGNCSAGELRACHGVTVCVAAAAARDQPQQSIGTPSPDATAVAVKKTSWLLVTSNAVLACLLVAVLAMAAVVLRKKRIKMRTMFRSSSWRRSSFSMDGLLRRRWFSSSKKTPAGSHAKRRPPSGSADELSTRTPPTLGGSWQRVLLRHRVDRALLSLVEIRATGMFGQVWIATLDGHDGFVVVKQLKPEAPCSDRKADDDEDEEESQEDARTARFVAEAQLHSALSHPRIVAFLGVCWTKPSDLQLVLEYVPRGDLRAFLDRVATEMSAVNELTMVHRLRVALQISEALVYLHSLDPMVIHRDLKSPNVLLDEQLSAKVADFGCARRFGGRGSRATSRSSITTTLRPMDQPDTDADGPEVELEDADLVSDRLTEAVGTIRWIAPEVLTSARYDESVDVYSLGMILSELLTGERPYAHVRDENQRALPDSVLATMLVSGAVRSFESSGSTTTDDDGGTPAPTPTPPTGASACWLEKSERGASVVGEMQRLVQRCASFRAIERPTAVQVAFELRGLLAEAEGERGRSEREEEQEKEEEKKEEAGQLVKEDSSL